MTFGTYGPTIHSSVFREAARPLRQVVATLRPGGALRYRCPVTGSFLVLTDDDTLRELARPRARTRCAACGELHLLIRTSAADEPAQIVAQAATP